VLSRSPLDVLAKGHGGEVGMIGGVIHGQGWDGQSASDFRESGAGAGTLPVS
jgi:hypothetical protein